MKTGSFTETNAYSQAQPHEMPVFPPSQYPIRSRVHRPSPYEIRENYPGRDFMSHRSEHLNELSQNLVKKYNQSHLIEPQYPSRPPARFSDPHMVPTRPRNQYSEALGGKLPFPPVENEYRKERNRHQNDAHFQKQTSFNEEP